MESRKFIVANLGNLCINYRRQLLYAADARNNAKIIKKIYNSNVIYPSNLSSFGQLLQTNAWINTLMKMDPDKYYFDRHYFSFDLEKKHIEQVNFAKKVLPIISKYDFDDSATVNKLTDRYGMFLSLCLQNKNKSIVPTLIEDFVWHSHMTDNGDYVKMTKSMFGGILQHRTDIDLEKASTETKEIRKNFYEQNGYTIGLLGLGAAAVISAHNGQQDQKREEHTTNSLSDCGIDIVGFGPTGIYNPINPWASVNPLSPYYAHHNHNFAPSSSYEHTSDFSDSNSNSDSDSSCSSSSCGSSCGGGGD